jgi:hypothetical protein
MYSYLELAVDLVSECTEQLLPVGVGVPAADCAKLSGVAVGQDEDDQLLVRAPPCDRRTRETGQSISMRSEMRAGKMPRPEETRGGPLKALRSCSQSSSTGGDGERRHRWGSTSLCRACGICREWGWCGDQGGRGEERRFMWGREGFAGNDDLVVVEGLAFEALRSGARLPDMQVRVNSSP